MAQLSARGVGNVQVSVEASKHVNITINGQLAVQLLRPAYPKPLSGEVRHEIEALATAQEAAELYRELVGRNRNAFAERFVQAHWTLGGALNASDCGVQATLVLAEAIRNVPDIGSYPDLYLPLYVGSVQRYVKIAKMANVEADEGLMQEVERVLAPYLNKEGEQ